MRAPNTLPIVPASFFSIVLGLAGLANAWRIAHALWDMPAWIGEVLMLIAAAVWLVVAALFAAKWTFRRGEARAEADNLVQCCFIGLAGVATMLIAQGAIPYSLGLAWVLFALGATFTIGFTLWRTGLLWQGGRPVGAATAVLYLPSGAGGFVTGATAAALGAPDWGQLAFGAALFSWLAIDSVLLHRLYTEPAMVPALRPTMGIQLAPPAVGAATYLAVGGGAPDVFAHMLLGYAILQALLLARLMPWIGAQKFTASYWAFTFGATALAGAAMRLVQHGDTGALPILAPILFVLANLLVLAIAAATIGLVLKGELLPKPQPVATKA
jgi:tellurite resistance protein